MPRNPVELPLDSAAGHWSGRNPSVASPVQEAPLATVNIVPSPSAKATPIDLDSTPKAAPLNLAREVLTEDASPSQVKEFSDNKLEIFAENWTEEQKSLLSERQLAIINDRLAFQTRIATAFKLTHKQIYEMDDADLKEVAPYLAREQKEWLDERRLRLVKRAIRKDTALLVGEEKDNYFS